MRRASSRVLLAPLILVPFAAGGAAAQQSDTAASVGGAAEPMEVRVRDLTPGFLTFYEAAVEENADKDRTHSLVHEFTHAVHHTLADLSEGWERTVARTLFSEGLANRAIADLTASEPAARRANER